MSPRVALVLGGGGHTGQAFHLGALTALAETGFDPRSADVLVGTSAGSLVAAGLAAGLSVADQRAQLLGEPLSAEGARLRSARQAASVRTAPSRPPARGPLAPGALLAAARRPRGVRAGSLAAGLLPAGRVPTEGISRALQQVFGGSWPDRDLRVCAVRTRDAQRVVFGTPGAPRVDVGTAVAASCAIPAYFAPVAVGDELYVDGGVHSPTNADVVAADRPDLVLVLSPMSISREALRRPPADVALRVLLRSYLSREVRRLRRAGCRVEVLQPGPRDLAVMGGNPMDGRRGREVLATVAAGVRERLRGSEGLAAALAGR